MENSNAKNGLTPEQKHQRQFLLEILLPLLLLLIVVVGLTVLAIMLTGSNGSILSQWADISLILLVLPVMLFVLIAVALVILLSYFMGKWNRSLPPLLFLARTKVDEAATKVQKIIAAPVKPVVFTQSLIAGIKQFFTSLFKRSSI